MQSEEIQRERGTGRDERRSLLRGSTHMRSATTNVD